MQQLIITWTKYYKNANKAKWRLIRILSFNGQLRTIKKGHLIGPTSLVNVILKQRKKLDNVKIIKKANYLNERRNIEFRHTLMDNNHKIQHSH